VERNPRMSPPPVSPAVYSVPSAEVLARVEEALVRAERAAAEREQSLSARLQEPEIADPCAGWQEGFFRVEQRLAGLDADVRRVEEGMADAESALQAGEQALSAWLCAVRDVGERLAEWAGRAV